MRTLAKLIVTLFTLFAIILIVGFIFNFSIVFPFTVTNDIKLSSGNRLSSVSLATAATFAFWSSLFFFEKQQKLYPFQFLYIDCSFCQQSEAIVFYKYQLFNRIKNNYYSG